MIKDAPFSPGRRAFLRGDGPAARQLRPPWAVAQQRFLDLCTTCDACVEACPEQVLQRGDGGYPLFEPRHGECVFCRKCVEACKAGALDPALARPWTVRAEISPACLARNGVTCFSCRDACAESAIRFRPALGGARVDLDESRCTGCGACVGTCPVSAIRLSIPEAVDG